MRISFTFHTLWRFWHPRVLILNEFFMQGRNTIQEPRSHVTHLGSQIENENHLGIPLITVVVTIFGCYNHGPGGCYTPPWVQFPNKNGSRLTGSETEKPEKKRVTFEENSQVAGEGEQWKSKVSFGVPRGTCCLACWATFKDHHFGRYIWILFKVDRLEPRNWEHKNLLFPNMNRN